MSSSVDAPAVRAPRLAPAMVALVEREAAGEATEAERAQLEAEADAWRSTLWRLLRDTEDDLRRLGAISGPERSQVLADFTDERGRLVRALSRVDPAFVDDEPADAGTDEVEAVVEAGVARLQASWEGSRLVLWAGGPGVAPAPLSTVHELLKETGAPTSGWEAHGPVPLPGGVKAESVAAPVIDVLGWLVAVGAGTVEQEVGTSLRWVGRAAVLAVRLTAQGRVVPTLRSAKRARRGAADRARPADTSTLSVRWAPAMLHGGELRALAGAIPGAVQALDPRGDAQALTRTVLTNVVDAICRTAAARMEVPAAPPAPRTVADVAESVLARLDGSKFDAPSKAGSEVAARLERWARPVTAATTVRLVLQLDPPDTSEAWHLSLLAAGLGRQLVPAEVALATASGGDRRIVDELLQRLERFVPALRRPGGRRRGEVVLSQDEAWELMTRTGPSLAAMGFEVRVPTLARRKATASLRLTADAGTMSVVGAHQLAQVRWSAVFDDVELDAATVSRLAAEARPMVRSRGRWVALDHADLVEAARALAERASHTQLTGAEMLRHALGLEGTPLAGGVQLEGTGWAADLLRSAERIATDTTTTPEGFQGQLRSYQAEALAWLGFLEGAGMGGCLALDMGLGKTPTLLAHLRRTSGHGPSLVIAPPAVVGNWAAEAHRFVPELKVVVHHGSDRVTTSAEVAEVAERADVLITTYGTAVRDVDALAAVAWHQVVLDEAQVIKNPASETAQQLRRLPARSRIALTGTPIENGLGDLWAILDFTNPGLVGPRPAFIAQLSRHGEARAAAEDALRALNGLLVFRRTKAEPAIAAELPDRIDELDHCAMTTEQIGLYQAVLDELVTGAADEHGDRDVRKGQILAAITALKQICNHPAAYQHDDTGPLEGRSGKLARLEEIVDAVFAAGERVLVFTHFAEWGQRLAAHLTARYGMAIACYHGGLSRGARDAIVEQFQQGTGPGALVLSLKAGGTGLNLTAASHVVLYDRWWNPAVEDQARDRAWRIGQSRTVVAHRLVCPGTVDERVEEVVAGKRRIADLVLPASSSLGDLDPQQLRVALGLRSDAVLTEDAADAAKPPGDGGMSDRNRNRDKAGGAKEAKRFWGDLEELGPVEQVRPTDEPDALVRFLGPPSLPGQEAAAQHYFAVVYDKAVGLAGALAAAGGLLADDEG